jgi:tuberous sclerosis protein 2
MNGVNRHLLPLSDPKTAPTTFMRTLCTLLSRDTAHTPLQPPLTHILLSISDHLADADAAAIPDIMYKQQALTPTSPEWINNWRLLLMTPGMHAHSRPLTRDVIARLLDNMYAILTEMADYRRELGAVVTEHIQAHAERDRQDTDDAAWRILSEEVVLRSTEIEHGPILYDEEGEVLVDNIHPDVESVLSFLEKASLENTAEDPITLISSESGLTSSPALSSAATSPSLSRGVSDYTQPSLDAVINSISLPAASSGDVSSYSLALQATSALVTAFGSLVFTPLSLGEHNLAVAVRIFRILLDTMLHARCPRSRLCALQFLMRMRADRDHRLHFAGDATNTDSHVQRLAGQIQRCEPPPVPAVASPQPVQSAQAAEAESPRYRSRGIKPSKIASSSSNSRSRSRAPPPSFDTALPTPRNALWRLPDIPSFHLSEDQSFSERLTAYDPAGPGRKVVLPLSDYVDAITTVLRGERDWEILSYVLCHLPSQLANKHLLCGPKCKTAVVQMTDAFCVGILEGTFASDITAWPHRLYASDATALAYSAITVLISYRRHFEPARQHRLVETLYRGLSGPPVSALTCLHALTLAAFELRPSMTKFLADIVDRLTQIMSNPQAPVHIINFLAMVGSLPELYANFTQDQFKKVFAVCLRYLQDFNRQGPAQKSSWALSQHVRLLSYAALYVWFLAINLSDRSTHITDITRGLLEANEGNPEVDEPTEVCFDWLARYTYASADPRPASSALDEIVMKSSAGSTGAPEHVPIEKTWIMGNSTVITIKTLPKRGWVEIIARRASGLTKILARLENLPLVGPGDVDPDMLTLPGTLMMDKDAAHVPRDLLVPGEGTGEDAEVRNVMLSSRGRC